MADSWQDLVSKKFFDKHGVSIVSAGLAVDNSLGGISTEVRTGHGVRTKNISSGELNILPEKVKEKSASLISKQLNSKNEHEMSRLLNKPGLHRAVALRREAPPVLSKRESLDNIISPLTCNNEKPLGESWQKEGKSEMLKDENKKPETYNFVKFTAFDPYGQIHTSDGERKTESVNLDQDKELAVEDEIFVKKMMGNNNKSDGNIVSLARDLEENNTRAQAAISGASLENEAHHKILFGNDEKPVGGEIEDLGPASDSINNQKNYEDKNELNPLIPTGGNDGERKKPVFSEVTDTIVPNEEEDAWNFDNDKPRVKAEDAGSILEVNEVIEQPNSKIVVSGNNDENPLEKERDDLATRNLSRALESSQNNTKNLTGEEANKEVAFQKSEAGLEKELNRLRELSGRAAGTEVTDDGYLAPIPSSLIDNDNSKEPLGSNGLERDEELELLGRKGNNRIVDNKTLVESPVNEEIEPPKPQEHLAFVGDDTNVTIADSRILSEASARDETTKDESIGDKNEIISRFDDANAKEVQPPFFKHVDNIMLPDDESAPEHDTAVPVDNSNVSGTEANLSDVGGNNRQGEVNNDEGIMHLPTPEELATQADIDKPEKAKSINQEVLEPAEPAAPLEMVSDNNEFSEEANEPVVAETPAISDEQQAVLSAQELAQESIAAQKTSEAINQSEEAPQNTESVQPSIETDENIQVVESKKPVEEARGQNVPEIKSQIDPAVVDGDQKIVEVNSNNVAIDGSAMGDNIMEQPKSKVGFFQKLFNSHPNGRKMSELRKISDNSITTANLHKIGHNEVEEPLDKAT